MNKVVFYRYPTFNQSFALYFFILLRSKSGVLCYHGEGIFSHLEMRSWYDILKLDL